jgi:hypothetical protein
MGSMLEIGKTLEGQLPREIRKPMDLSYESIKLNVIANLLRLLEEIYGAPEAKAALSKVEGEEIVMAFPALKGAIVIRPHGGRLFAEKGDSETAVARINLKVKDEKIFDILEDVAKSSRRWGIFKVLFKYVLTTKIRLHGSLRAIMATFASLMIGDHEMYKRIKVKVLESN